MNERRILINGISSVVQVIIVSVILFVLYRFILKEIGTELLGIWSLIISATSMAHLANFGLSASVVKFAAKYLARGETDTATAIIETSAISLAVLCAVFVLITYKLAPPLLRLVITPAQVPDALLVLPYALSSLWVGVLAGVFQSGLDAYQRIDLRCIVLGLASLANLGLVIALVPHQGLQGVALANLAQNAIALILSLAFLKRHLPALSILPRRWNYVLFREMLGYGICFQFVSIAQILYDPITKFLLARFGGLAATGYYEMASRAILQFRSLLVSANQVMVPTIAHCNEFRPDYLIKLYKDSYRLIIFVSVPFFALVVATGPILCQIWIGKNEPFFILSIVALSIGWFFNTISGPAYFSNLGTGDLAWNAVSHFAIGFLNISLGLVFGRYLGGTAMVIVWAASLAIGSSITPIAYHRVHKIPLRDLLPAESMPLLLSAFVSVLLAWASYYGVANYARVVGATMAIFSCVIVLGVFVWRNPVRRLIVSRVRTHLAGY